MPTTDSKATLQLTTVNVSNPVSSEHLNLKIETVNQRKIDARLVVTPKKDRKNTWFLPILEATILEGVHILGHWALGRCRAARCIISSFSPKIWWPQPNDDLRMTIAIRRSFRFVMGYVPPVTSWMNRKMVFFRNKKKRKNAFLGLWHVFSEKSSCD